jgi:competence protein ComEC
MTRLLSLAWIVGIASIGLKHNVLLDVALVVWCVLLVLCVTVYLVLWYQQRLQHWVFCRAAVLILATLAMLGSASHYVDAQLQSALAVQVRHSQQIDGIVYIKKMTQGRAGQRQQLAQLLLPEHGGSIRIVIYPPAQESSDFEWQLGQYYQVSLALSPLGEQVNSGGFDVQAWWLAQHIHGSARLLSRQALQPQQLQAIANQPFVQQQQHRWARLQLAIERWRLVYRQQLVGTDTKVAHPQRGLLLALLTGDRLAIPADTTQLYRVMGISHLLAISGPHVLLLASLTTWVVMRLLHLLMRHGIWQTVYLRLPKQWLYLPLFLSMISFYVLFSGFEIPAIRTWLMATLCCSAMLLQIPISKSSLLLWAACVVLAFDSLAILSAAFWLSFVASAMMLLIYHSMLGMQPSGFWQTLGILLQRLWQVQWRICWALLPIVLWQFKAVALIAPVMNMLAIPMLSVVVIPLNLIAALLWPIIPWFAECIWQLDAAILAVFHASLEILRPLAEGLYWPSYFTQHSLLCLTVAVLIMLIPAGCIPRYWALLFVLPLGFQQEGRPLLQMDVLDVGQGQAVLLRTEHHQMLVDTGRSSWSATGSSLAQQEIVPYLRAQGLRRLDEVLLTHMDDDHSGGIADIVNSLKVDVIRANRADAAHTDFAQSRFERCVRGQTWQWDQVQFEILHPDIQDPTEDENEASCVLLIRAPMQQADLRILLMADVGWQTEYQLLRRYPELRADIMVLGHHGSKYSSAYEFLQQINPQLAVISVGADNRYGHPSAEVRARLAALNIVALSTIEAGAVHLQLNHSSQLWQLEMARQQHRWLRP